MEEADVQPVDLGDELRHGVEPRLRQSYSVAQWRAVLFERA